MKTTIEQLNDINAAIYAIQNGAQEYQIGSRKIVKPDLGLLYAERDRLQLQLAQETGSTTQAVSFYRR